MFGPVRNEHQHSRFVTLRTLICMQDVRSIPTQNQPVVFGQWLHAAGLPTVLIYGHYDVQPVDPLELWHTQPFDTQLINGEFLGRGANDDKGGLLQPIQAIEALLQSEGKLPVNVKVDSVHCSCSMHMMRSMDPHSPESMPCRALLHQAAIFLVLVALGRADQVETWC